MAEGQSTACFVRENLRSGVMTHPSASPTLVLHGLRIKGFAETDVIAEAVGLDDVTVVRSLEQLAEAGLVTRKQGVEVSGWVLTPQGRSEHEKLLADELDAAGGRADIERIYAEFTVLNPELLQLCTDWQLRDGVVNDHHDAAYDAEVISRLTQLHERAFPVLAALGEVLVRFTGYPPRLQRAVEEVQAGHHDWFTRPLIDSYHTVWFELHEDLLATLGLVRAEQSG
jgi:DNA-binding MarR family transcriptional regulator